MGIVGAHLAKLLENFRLIFRRDPDAGVSYRYFHRAIARLGVDSDPSSLGSELDRVGKQIQKDLLDLTLVADELAEPLVEIDVECNAMAGGTLERMYVRCRLPRGDRTLPAPVPFDPPRLWTDRESH